MDQKKKAELFRNLHLSKEVLLLPNAWDVASACIVEEAGFPAVATSTAGVAFALGYPDGQKIPRAEMLAVVARIARTVNIPVTADVESGYGNRPADAAQTARDVIEAGAVGMNLEDVDSSTGNSLVDLSLQLEKIAAVRDAGAALAVPIVLNARTDVYLLEIGDPAKRYDQAVRRLRAFRDAGADCVFLPGVRDAALIGRLVSDLHCPVNILAGPGSPSVPELHKLGVARVSLRSSAMRAALGHFRRVAREMKTTGTYSTMEDSPSFAEVNGLLQRTRK